MEHWRSDTMENWSTRRKTCSIVKFSKNKLGPPYWEAVDKKTLNHGAGQGWKLINFNYSKINLFYLQTQFVTRIKQSPSRLQEPASYIAKVKSLSLCKIHIKHTNTPCGQNVEFFDSLAKLRKVTLSFAMSVCPHGTSRLPLDRFSIKFHMSGFFKDLSTKLSFIKIW